MVPETLRRTLDAFRNSNFNLSSPGPVNASIGKELAPLAACTQHPKTSIAIAAIMVLTLNDAAKFRTALKDAIPDAQLARLNDADLLRFLEARRGDEALAKQMVVDYVEFRGKWKLDERPMDFIDGRTVLFPIRGYEPLVKDANMDLSNKTTRMWAKWLRHHGGGVWHKFDREGRPLVIELPGLHDAKGFLADCDPEELMEWHVRISEALTGPIMDFAAKKHGGDGQLTCIFDLSGLGMHQMHLPALNLLKSITDADQKYYPERLNKLFIINNPYVFTLVGSLGWRETSPACLHSCNVIDLADLPPMA